MILFVYVIVCNLIVYGNDERLDCLIGKSDECRVLKETERKKIPNWEKRSTKMIRDPRRIFSTSISLVDFTYHFHPSVLNTFYHDTSTTYKFSNFHPI